MSRLGLVNALVIISVLIALLISPAPLAFASEPEKWQGIDETVVGRVAKEHGREARSPLITTDQGDLLLFVFLIAGAVGGFAMGYYWRSLTEKRTK